MGVLFQQLKPKLTVLYIHAIVHQAFVDASHQIIAIRTPLMPIKPSKPHCEKTILVALPVKVTGEDVGAVGDVLGLTPGVELVLDVEVELSVTSMNTPPAMAGGETVLAFVAALL